MSIVDQTQLLAQRETISDIGAVRRAQKVWTCLRSDNFETVGGWTNPDYVEPDKRPGCTPTIEPGDYHFEYLGEAMAYQSGTRYCAACAVAVWIEDAR